MTALRAWLGYWVAARWTCARVTSAGDVAPTSCSARQDLLAQELQDTAGAGFAVDGQAPQRRTAGEDRLRAEGERLHDIRAAADAAVDQHRTRPATASTTSGSASIVAETPSS